MTNSKKKGNYWENRLAEWLTVNGIKAWKDGASGGSNREKSDVGNNLNLHLEMKAGNQVPKKIYDWYDKVVLESNKTHNTPYVVVHKDNRPKDEFLFILNGYDWLELVSGEKLADLQSGIPNTDKWLIKSAIEALKKVLKILEKYSQGYFFRLKKLWKQENPIKIICITLVKHT